MYISGFQSALNPPTEDNCKVVVIDDNGCVSDAIYTIKDGYDVRDKSVVPHLWAHNNFSEQTIITDTDSVSAIHIADPATDEVVFQLSGFCMKDSWNVELIKSEDDIVHIADSIGQIFYERCINALMQNEVKK